MASCQLDQIVEGAQSGRFRDSPGPRTTLMGTPTHRITDAYGSTCEVCARYARMLPIPNTAGLHAPMHTCSSRPRCFQSSPCFVGVTSQVCVTLESGIWGYFRAADRPGSVVHIGVKKQKRLSEIPKKTNKIKTQQTPALTTST